MNAITDIWRQLVRRRLWPVAILLVAALAAVPVLLAKEPEPAPPAPPVAPATTASEDTLAADPIVTLASEQTGGTRPPLGKRHDIFKPTKKAPKAAKADDDESDTSGGGEQPAEDESTGGSSSGGGDGGGGGEPTPVQPGTEPQEPKTYPLYSLVMRFTAGEESEKGYLPRGSALPTRDEPLLIYLGLLGDHKTAVFMVDSTIEAVGDGECHPTPENCETVRMQVGDTMFFDVVNDAGEPTGTQFQLDLLKINKQHTTNAAKAARSAKLAKVASATELRERVFGLGAESFRRLGVVTRTG